MKQHPDINDTLRAQGRDGVRARHDRAERFRPNGGSTRSHRITLVPFKDIQLGTDRQYLVKGLIPRVGLTVVWGPPKSGKSFWVFDVALHVALGWDYRGRRVHAGAVVYAAFEGASGIKTRKAAFEQRLLADHPGSTVPFYLMPVTLDLVRDYLELIAEIKTTLGETQPAAVVLDTLNRSLTGSESSDEDMSSYIRAADAIRESFNAAVLIVHHCGIDGTRPRGHTSLTGAAEAQLAVKRDAANNVVVTVEYAKDGPQGDTVVSRLEALEVGLDEDGEPITSCVVVPADGTEIKPTKRLTGSDRVAHDALCEAVLEAGEPAPADQHFPRGVRTVPVSVWRKYCDAKTITDSDKPNSKRKAFLRAASKLQELRVVGIWSDRAWLAK